jgi:transcriptional regulator NrdR family protein
MTLRTARNGDAHAQLPESRCESCGGLYDFDQVEVRDIPPIVPGELVQRMRVCTNCYHRFTAMSAGQLPT